MTVGFSASVPVRKSVLSVRGGWGKSNGSRAWSSVNWRSLLDRSSSPPLAGGRDGGVSKSASNPSSLKGFLRGSFDSRGAEPNSSNGWAVTI